MPSLFVPTESSRNEEIEEIVDYDIDFSQANQKEVRICMSRLKKNNTTGADNYSAELYKTIADKLTN